MSLSQAKLIFSVPSARVKCLDFHSNNQLLLAALFDGSALVIDSLSSSVIRTIQFYESAALRTCRWIPGTNKLAVGGDNGTIIFYDFVKSKIYLTVNAHKPIVRSIAFHPKEKTMLSCGDDKLVKLWNISNDECTLIRTFESHSALVMDVKWSLREPTTFASASFDGTVIFWDSNQESPRFTQNISKKCINCISFASVGDKSLFAASADDSVTYIIDMQSRSVVSKLDCHSGNVSRVEFHPQRPLIFTCSEDSDAIAYSISTYAKEMTYTTPYKRIWSMAVSSSYPFISFGCDEGLVVYKFKYSGTPMALDPAGRHFIIAQISDIQTSAIKDLGEIVDGSELGVTLKDALTVEYIPEEIEYSPNGKFVSIVGNGEWNVFSTLGYKARAYGKGISVVWSNNNNCFGALTNDHYAEIHNAKEEPIRIDKFVTRIFGGMLFGLQDNSGITFIDWDSQEIIRRISIKAKEVKWDQTKVAMRTKDGIFVLEYNPEYETLESEMTGYEDSFSVVYQYDVKATSICWANGILLFTEGNNIKRAVGNVIMHVSTYTRPVTIIGYMQRENILLCADSTRNTVCFNLPSALLEFERGVLDGDVLDPSSIPSKYRDREARLMKQLGFTELALEVAEDNITKFEISLELNQLEEAEKYASNEQQFRRLSSIAIKENNVELALRSLKQCREYATLLLLYKAQGRIDDIKDLINVAEEDNQLNVAFNAALISGNKEKCVELLLKSKKYPEASLFARSNVPSMVSECVKQWKENSVSPRIAQQIASPEDLPDLFE